jgi:hypothetical protein
VLFAFCAHRADLLFEAFERVVERAFEFWAGASRDNLLSAGLAGDADFVVRVALVFGWVARDSDVDQVVVTLVCKSVNPLFYLGLLFVAHPLCLVPMYLQVFSFLNESTFRWIETGLLASF